MLSLPAYSKNAEASSLQDNRYLHLGAALPLLLVYRPVTAANSLHNLTKEMLCPVRKQKEYVPKELSELPSMLLPGTGGVLRMLDQGG